MRLTYLFLLFVTFATSVQARQDSIFSVLQDDGPIDSLIDMQGYSHQPDSQVIDNSEAINLMIQSNLADIENSIKEAVITELLQNEANTARQRRELEQQMDVLHQEDSLRRALQRHRIDSLKKTAIGAPVMLKYDTLYFIYAKIGSISALERANSQSKKIHHMAKDFSTKSDTIHLVEGYSTSDLVYNDIILASVSEYDALWMNTTRDSLASEYLQIIHDAIIVYKEQTALSNTLRIIGLCLLLIVVFFALLKGISFLFNHLIIRSIIRRKKSLFKGFKFRDFEILNSHQVMKMIVGILKIFKYIFYIILFYLTIPLLFSIFPPTQKYAEILFGWIINPVISIGNSFIDFLPDLFKIIIILIAVHYILKFFKYVTSEIDAKHLVIPGFYPDWAKATFNIIRILVFALTIVLIFQLLPWAKSPIFQGVSVFLGLLVSLGSTNVIANLMSGMVITYMRPFIQGDRIRIGETYGDIVEKTPFVIRIQTPKNEVVTVPNATVLSSNVVNYSARTKDSKDNGVVVNTIVTMGYDVPWVRLTQLLIDAALKTPFVLQEPPPFVLQTALNDFSVSYQINAYTKEASKMPFIYSELYKNIQDTLRDAGIEMVLPHYQAIRDGNPSTIPPRCDKPEPTN